MHSYSVSSKKNVRSQDFTKWSAVAAVALASISAAVAQPRYTVTELITPSGYELSVPYQINDVGLVAGYSTRPNDPNGFVATVWKNGGVTVLGRLKDGTYSIASAINSKGVVAGEGDDGDGRPLGCVTSGSKLVSFFSNNGGNTRLLSINDAGDMGGYYIKSGSGSAAAWRGAIWKLDAKDPRKSSKVDLPILPGGDPVSASAIPFAFNKSNEAAGWASNSVLGQHAAFWKNDAAHTIVDLRVFGSDWSSEASGLNDLGQVVGSSHPPFGSRPVLWDNDLTRASYELPMLPDHNYGGAMLINNKMNIIGFSAASEPGTWNVGTSRIVIWIDGIVYDLQSLLAPSDAGWTIQGIMSLNNPGLLAGVASRNGLTRAIVLTPVP